ncbi:MAG TPA: hypothetical protein VK555_14125 [Terriglobales bacterium]|jgi:hypothetical protein|nr:hypothetical protein [Terriglobales bacterium]HMJ22194.1 hypothetical protein [Terriglobales bacterium]
MERPLKDHISRLEQAIQSLNRDIMENRRTLTERNRIEADIRAAEMALAHYRAAFELEKKIASAG